MFRVLYSSKLINWEFSNSELRSLMRRQPIAKQAPNEDRADSGVFLKTLSTTYTYTPKNEVASITKYGETTEYSYTPSGKLKTKTKPDGTVIEYAYDKLGHLIKVNSETFTYNKLGHLISGTGFNRKVDPFGNVLKETLSNGLSIEKTYDDLDRPLTMTLPTGTIQYTYDQHLRSISYKGYTHAYAYNLAGHLLTSGLTSFNRDLAGQITQIKSPPIEQECRYDSRGNLIFAAPNTYQFDELSQLAGEFDSHFDPPDSPLTGKLQEHNGVQLSYDDLDRLIKANENTFTYDALDRRLSKNDELYLYDGQTEIGTYKNGHYYIKIHDILLDLDGAFAVPLFDGTYTLRYLIDPSSHEILNEYEFDPFGNPLHIAETLHNPYRYALKHYDEETDLIYFGKRYYNPATKRWITPDPAGPIDLVNLFTFVRNNPFRYHDYVGLFASLREGNLRSALGGMCNGALDFSLNFCHDLQLGAAYCGAPDWDMSLDSRIQMMESIRMSQTKQMTQMEGWLTKSLSIDASDPVYQSFRSNTLHGLEFGSLVTGGYGLAKGVMTLNRFAKAPSKISNIAKCIYRVESFQGELLNTHLTQVKKYGTQSYRQLQNNKIRYYGDIKTPKIKGEMIGRRKVREWDPETGFKRTWHETLDGRYNVRIVRPQINDGIKTHFVFDNNGNYEGMR